MRGLKAWAIAAAFAAALLVSLDTSAATAAPALSATSVSTQVATVAPVSLASSTTTAFTCYSQHVVIRLGSRGECVKVFQRWNNRWGVYNWHAPRLVVDGVYGYNSYRAAVMAQKVFGLVPDGVLGDRSWDVITYALM